MKGIFLFSSKIWYYWVELPVIAILIFSINANQYTTSFFKLYPLIVLCCIAIIFIAVFLFKGIKLSFQEIRYIGLFSSRDSADIEEGRTLRLTKKKFRNLEVSLFCTDNEPALSWAVREPGEDPLIVRMFHGYTSNSYGNIKKILRYFEIDEEDISIIIKESNFEKEYEKVAIKCYISDTEEKCIDILFKVTV